VFYSNLSWSESTPKRIAGINDAQAIKERVEEKIKLVEKYEKNILEQAKQKAEGVKTDIETKVENKIEEVKDKATKTILEKT